MTVAHLAFAVAMSASIVVAIRFEERDLARFHGEPYMAYQRRVGMLVPRLGIRIRSGSLPGSAR